MQSPFSGFGLKPVELSDQATLDAYFQSLSSPLSDYTFSQIFTWRNSLRMLWKQIDGHLCLFANGSGDLTLLMPPIGPGDATRALRSAFELMDQYNFEAGVPGNSRVEYVSQELLDRLDHTGLEVQPLGGDYIYDVRRMIDLAGGDLASKRQAKNRFLRNYAWRTEPYQPAKHLESCRSLLHSWKSFQDQQHGQGDGLAAIKRQKEALACELTLQWANELNLCGMVVYVRDAAFGSGDDSWAIRGFTFGEMLGRDQSSIVVEKTDLAVKGLAQFIFSEFCEKYWSHRPLVNVGDDWGLESLAWTKQSYRPVKRLQKFVVRQKKALQVAMQAPNVEPVVREACREDLSAALALEESCFHRDRFNRRQLQYLQQRRTAIFLVAEAQGQVVGQGIALIRQHRQGLSGRIYSLAVDEKWRGRKIGQRLLEGLIRRLSDRGARRIYLEVDQQNAAALKLYQRLGFRCIGKLADYYGAGSDALHMMWELPIRAVSAA
ncbi:MAG: GNAT family N-acetyltransferase [Phycisphaerales bacterium]|nr:GNAT family N-acetyltransferase [Phycisphaerales bacterium]